MLSCTADYSEVCCILVMQKVFYPGSEQCKTKSVANSLGHMFTNIYQTSHNLTSGKEKKLFWWQWHYSVDSARKDELAQISGWINEN